MSDSSGSDPDCEAGKDGVPYVIVVGNEEVASKKLTVTIRKKSQPNKPFREQMTADALIAAVKKDVEGKLFRPLYTPRKLSMKARYICIFLLHFSDYNFRCFFRFLTGIRQERNYLSTHT